jgi:hypothetical protein
MAVRTDLSFWTAPSFEIDTHEKHRAAVSALSGFGWRLARRRMITPRLSLKRFEPPDALLRPTGTTHPSEDIMKLKKRKKLAKAGKKTA